MIIEMILFLILVVAMGTIVAKAYEWRQDVLYGPYVGPGLSHQVHETDGLKGNKTSSVVSKMK